MSKEKAEQIIGYVSSKQFEQIYRDLGNGRTSALVSVDGMGANKKLDLGIVSEAYVKKHFFSDKLKHATHPDAELQNDCQCNLF